MRCSSNNRTKRRIEPFWVDKSSTTCSLRMVSELCASNAPRQFDFKYDGLGQVTLANNNVSGVGKGRTGTLNLI